MPITQLPQPPKKGSARFDDWMWRLWKTVQATTERGPRNRIIGGDFTTNPFQAGSSFAAAATGTYVADMFRIDHSTAGVVTVTQTADAPTAAEAGVYSTKCLHIDCTTAEASIAAGDYFILSTNIEGLNAASFGFGQAGERYVTLGFWVKTTKTGTYCVALRNSATDRSHVREYTVTTADDWEFKEVSFPVDTSGTWLYDTGIGLRVSWCLLSGSTYQTTKNEWAAGNYFATASQVNALDSTSNNFKIQLVSLEAGTVASPFEHMSADAVERACQRYYEKSYERGSAPGANAVGGYAAILGLTTTSGTKGFYVPFKVTKRITPTTVSAWDYVGNSGKVSTYDLAAARTDNVAYSALVVFDGNVGVSINSSTAAGILFHWTADARI